jgi:hypothetical protein
MDVIPVTKKHKSCHKGLPFVIALFLVFAILSFLLAQAIANKVSFVLH